MAGLFTNTEVNALHAEAFDTRAYDESEWNWVELVHRHSLGWVVARDDAGLVGFVNVLWDGLVHAWLQDVMVATGARGQGIGTELVRHACAGAKAAGCEYLHVDFDDHLRRFYYDACGFRPTSAGLMALDLIVRDSRRDSHAPEAVVIGVAAVWRVEPAPGSAAGVGRT